ncbi:IS630 family transposase [Orientia tsutsugamushi]|nr:IS630 family transposase [Orientia tsutsugamushi]
MESSESKDYSFLCLCISVKHYFFYSYLLKKHFINLKIFAIDIIIILIVSFYDYSFNITSLNTVRNWYKRYKSECHYKERARVGKKGKIYKIEFEKCVFAKSKCNSCTSRKTF